MKKNLWTALVAITLFAGCSRSDEFPTNSGTPQPPASVPTGKVTGKVTAKNGTKAVGGALVFTFDAAHKMYHTYSDEGGNFVLDAPEGQRTIHIQTGGGSNFRTELTTTVEKGKSIALNVNDTKLNQIANIAYVKGSFDKIEDIIASLGYTATQITYSDLQNINLIAQYDIIFLNCGSRTSAAAQDTQVYANLSTFVSNGGSLYASDWDAAYLVGGGVNTTSCGMPGGFIADSLLCATATGPSGYQNNCTVSDPALAAAIGFNTLNIHYDMGAWEKIINYDSNFWDVMVQNQNEALMIKTDQYHNTNAPTMQIGNAANSGHITICHKPNGSNPVTITIPQSAWQAHQSHGDTLGSCTSSSASGNIYCTTFHNHASGNIGNTGPILQYVILNL